MIARIWRGRASTVGADAYHRHVITVVVPKLERIAGFRGARLLRRDFEGEVEFLVTTDWESWDAIRAFAGARPELAVVEPEAGAVLTRADEHVQHFEVAHDTGV